MKKLTHAKMAPSVVRTQGLFHLPRTDLNQSFEAIKEIDGARFKFEGTKLLTVDDLDVLIGLVAIAGRQCDSYQTSKQLGGDSAALRVRKMMTKSVDVETTYSALARELERSPGGDTWPLISESLKRLIAVTVYVTPAGRTDANRFIAGHLFDSLAADEHSSSIVLRMSPVLAAAILGGPGEFLQFNTYDFRKLREKSGLARLLYLYLHSFYAAQWHEISTSRLIEVLYSTDVGPSLVRKYRARVKAAMARIGDLAGWQVEPLDGGFRFRRGKQ